MTSQDWVLIIGAAAAATVSILGAVAALWAKVHSLDQHVTGQVAQLADLTRASTEATALLTASDPPTRVQSVGPVPPPTTA
jgi:hypothetical protein